MPLPIEPAVTLSLRQHQTWNDAAPLLVDGSLPRLPNESQCKSYKERRSTRWEHEHVVEEVYDGVIPIPTPCGRWRDQRLCGSPQILIKRLANLAAEMTLNVLAHNMTRAMNIVGKRG